MAAKGDSILGGKSVYCINESQHGDAIRLAEADSESGRRVREAIATLEKSLNRNERAAVAFVLIERLRQSRD